MYFFKDDSYYQFSGERLNIERGYPRLINEKWAFCSEDLRNQLDLMASAAFHSTVHSSSVYIIILASCLVIMLPALRWLS